MIRVKAILTNGSLKNCLRFLPTVYFQKKVWRILLLLEKSADFVSMECLLSYRKASRF